MMLLVMGGKPPQLSVYCFSRANVIRAEFNTGRKNRTVSHRTKVIFSKNLSLNYISNNELAALTPPGSVAIISVSVRSAELRLELYV